MTHLPRIPLTDLEDAEGIAATVAAALYDAHGDGRRQRWFLEREDRDLKRRVWEAEERPIKPGLG